MIAQGAFINQRKGARLRPRRGFTAVEVTMVAAVIAILTLIALPMFRARIEDSRRKAAKDEMSQIAKAEELAYAETGYHYRLNDLDNTTQFTDTDTSASAAVPLFAWNRRLTLNPYGERWQLCHSDRGWNGPYISYRKFEWLDRLFSKFDPAMFTTAASPAGGPIFLYDMPGGQDLYLAADAPRVTDIYPLDPWGNPYFFFGIGALHPGSGGVDALDFPKCVVYSMGPNGQPGDGTPPIASPNYWRYPVIAYPGTNCLGLGDDLSFEF